MKNTTKIATKALASIMSAALFTNTLIKSGGTKLSTGKLKRQEARLEKLQQHHDRKLQLRAQILGTTPEQLKEELKCMSSEQVRKKHGFKDIYAYYAALIGKIKEELKLRGWNESKINHFLMRQQLRYATVTA